MKPDLLHRVPRHSAQTRRCDLVVENVLALLEKFALLLGLNKSAAQSLQLEFSDNILAHELQLETAGLCDESLCSVLNVEVYKANGHR